VRVEFSQFYETEAPRLVRAVTLVVGEPVLAEDAVAEAFARAWARWSRVRTCDRPAAWVMRVALNEARSRFRRRRVERRKAPALARPDTVTDPEPPTSELWARVAALPAQERELIALRYVADLPQPEIARIVGIPLGTVASALHRARQRLGAGLRDVYEDSDAREEASPR
jgi:RNA polymerase sigma-70 factor (sigma-E family)